MELENQQNIALNHIHNHIKCDWSKKKKKQFKKRDYQKECKNKTQLHMVRKKLTYKVDKVKVTAQRNICHTNGEQKRAEVEILMSDKVDFIISNINRAKYGHYTMKKVLIL